jgi:NadR type nicotinamide-nucleotide adenylyltransferase
VTYPRFNKKTAGSWFYFKKNKIFFPQQKIEINSQQSIFQDMLKKVVIIGPESTGKTTLCRQLAQHYATRWCPEYAREYLLANGTQYTYEDLLVIAKGQVVLENEYTGQMGTTGSLLFIDTNLYVMKVWCEFVFGKCHRYILEGIVERKYDLYLLCNTDLPWVKDELREYPDLESRRQLYRIYEDCMINQLVPWTVISGNDEERLQTAIHAVDQLLK